MRANEVELAVANYFNPRVNLIIPNVSWGFCGLYYEADMIVVTKSDYAKEIEIKVSKHDLIRDKEKKHRHDWKMFRELYFAIPFKLLEHKEHIPERAGIIVVKEGRDFRTNKKFYYAEMERRASPTRTNKLTLQEKYNLARLGALRIWNLN